MSQLQDAYNQLGADYDDVLKRLMNETLVQRFVGKFMEDPSFDSLKTALAEKDVKQAFMAAHTLKGICSNLGFSNLFAPASELTEVLRAESLEGTEELFAQVEAEYNKTVETLKPIL